MGDAVIDRMLQLHFHHLPPHLRGTGPGNLGQVTGIEARIIVDSADRYAWLMRVLPDPAALLDRDDLCRDHVTVSRIMAAAKAYRCGWVMIRPQYDGRERFADDDHPLRVWPIEADEADPDHDPVESAEPEQPDG